MNTGPHYSKPHPNAWRWTAARRAAWARAMRKKALKRATQSRQERRIAERPYPDDI